MKAHRVSALAAAFAISATQASTPPPDAPSLHGASTAQPPATHIKLGAIAVVLEETSLREVAQSMGAGKIAHLGDAGESQYWLCYSSDNSRVWIISAGEMGGSDHEVTRIVVRHGKSSSNEECPTLEGKLLRLSINDRDWLGKPISEVTKAIGKPSIAHGSMRLYEYVGNSGEVDAQQCPPTGFDVMNWLAFESQNDEVTTIHLGQISSC
jgi:hypothetical protein